MFVCVDVYVVIAQNKKIVIATRNSEIFINCCSFFFFFKRFHRHLNFLLCPSAWLTRALLNYRTVKDSKLMFTTCEIIFKKNIKIKRERERERPWQTCILSILVSRYSTFSNVLLNTCTASKSHDVKSSIALFLENTQHSKIECRAKNNDTGFMYNQQTETHQFFSKHRFPMVNLSFYENDSFSITIFSSLKALKPFAIMIINNSERTKYPTRNYRFEKAEKRIKIRWENNFFKYFILPFESCDYIPLGNKLVSVCVCQLCLWK